MAHVGEKPPPLGLIGLKPGDHLVEAAGEIAHRPGPGPRDRDAGRVVAVLDAIGGLDELVEREGHAAERPAPSGDREDSKDDDSDP